MTKYRTTYSFRVDYTDGTFDVREVDGYSIDEARNILADELNYEGEPYELGSCLGGVSRAPQVCLAF